MRELKYGPTRLLATAVWLRLKCKYFNSGTAKEACTAFEVRAKQLFKLLLGKVYLGGAATKCPAQKERSQITPQEEEKCEGTVCYKGRQ